MHETIVRSVNVFILPKFIKAQHYKRHGKHLYKERNSIYVTGFRKTDHIVTIDIARNTDLKY